MQFRTRSNLLAFIFLFSTLYAAFGVASPFFPVFLSTRGATPEQIGLLLSFTGLVRLVSGPVAGRIADRLHALRSVLVVCTLSSGLFALSFLPANRFPILLTISLFYAAMLAPTTSLADALAIRIATASANSGASFEYGWVRGSGSAAFVIGLLLSGQMLRSYPLASTLVAQAIALIVAAGSALLIPNIIGMPEENAAIFRSGKQGWSSLVHNRPFRCLVLVAAIVLGSHAMHDSFAMIAWSSAGVPPSVTSILWSEQVVAEVVIFTFLGPSFLRRIGPVPVIGICAAAATVRWTVMGLTSSVFALSLLEPLHGLTFALLHLACMRILVLVTPNSLAGTSQAIYAFGIGATSSLLTFVSGYLYADLGQAGFFVMGAIAAASLPAIWALSGALDEQSH